MWSDLIRIWWRMCSTLNENAGYHAMHSMRDVFISEVVIDYTVTAEKDICWICEIQNINIWRWYVIRVRTHSCWHDIRGRDIFDSNTAGMCQQSTWHYYFCENAGYDGSIDCASYDKWACLANWTDFVTWSRRCTEPSEFRLALLLAAILSVWMHPGVETSTHCTDPSFDSNALNLFHSDKLVRSQNASADHTAKMDENDLFARDTPKCCKIRAEWWIPQILNESESAKSPISRIYSIRVYETFDFECIRQDRPKNDPYTVLDFSFAMRKFSEGCTSAQNDAQAAAFIRRLST